MSPTPEGLFVSLVAVMDLEASPRAQEQMCKLGRPRPDAKDVTRVAKVRDGGASSRQPSPSSRAAEPAE